MAWPGGRAARAPLALAVSLSIARPGVALASEPDASNLSRAHDAYARGAAAFAQGDYARAARELSTADALVPDSVTLRAALDAVTLADDPVLGSDLIARARRDPSNAPLAHAAALAEQRFVHRTGAVIVRCDGCLAVLDGASAPVGKAIVVLPGVHTVSVQRHAGPETRLVSVGVDETREVLVHALEVPAGTGDAAGPAPRGLAPGWFVGAVVVSVALGATTAWSAVDTANRHATFDADGCAALGSAACVALASTGQSDQARTLGLGIATGVVVAGAALLGGLGTRWHTPRHEVALDVTGPAAVARVTF
jgi:hypothetical protein